MTIFCSKICQEWLVLPKLCNQPPLPPKGGGGRLVVSGKWPLAPPRRRGPVGMTPRMKNNFFNRLQGPNYTPYACLGTTYGTEISSRSQPCHRLDQKTEKNAAFWQKRPKMARFGVHPLFAPHPLPISPRAGVKSDITRGQDAKKGVTKAKKRATVKNFAPRERSSVAWSDDFSLWKRNFPKPLTPRLYMKFF